MAGMIHYQSADNINQTPVSQATPLPTVDLNGAVFSGVTDMPVDGTTYAAGRSFQIECTVAGNVKITFSDASVRTIPVSVGMTVLPYAVTKWTVSGVSSPATATYANLK